jgi:predicted NUDIX family NTP pyrophosphohydrolase
VIAFSGKADFDTASLSSNTFEIEWPPRSGRLQVFPEIDRAEWFDLALLLSFCFEVRTLSDRLVSSAP